MNNELAPSRFLLRCLLTIVTICFLLMGCGGSKVSNINDTSENELKVMAYNIHHTQPMGKDYIDLGVISQVIRDADPDLVALQEVIPIRIDLGMVITGYVLFFCQTH